MNWWTPIRFERLAKYVRAPCDRSWCSKRASWAVSVGDGTRRLVCGVHCRQIHKRWERAMLSKAEEKSTGRRYKEYAALTKLARIAREISSLRNRLRRLEMEPRSELDRLYRKKMAKAERVDKVELGA